MTRVAIAHLQDAVPVRDALVRAAVRETLAAEEHAAAAEVSVAVMDDAQIRDLNRRYRGSDAATDVLAFPQDPLPGAAAPLLGDVVISAERAREQAREYGHTADREIALLVVHGVLHLLGYDDEMEDGAAQMWERQRVILDRLEARRALR